MAQIKTTITICTSCSFYRQAIEVETELKKMGYEVIIPTTAREMQRSGDFDVDRHKSWFGDANDYPKKAALMREHFDEIERGDAILVPNYEKRGIQNYIGGNVLMEMAIAFHLKKPIFILNEVPEESAFEEEIRGMLPTVLHGKLDDLPVAYKNTRRLQRFNPLSSLIYNR